MTELAEIDDALAQRLMAAAREAATRAYAPYSRFPVGAAALTENGDVVTGANVENASYGLTSCAERTACCTAAAAGHRSIVAIAVAALKVETVTPCGACRQVLQEFRPRDRDLVVIVDGRDGLSRVALAELLPRAFSRRELDNPPPSVGVGAP
jgi:cytidine deaminase